ncbi:MAG: hypothetical protein FWG65_01265 [Turicibacter sp.]|nr:hypothetical protein [Turicibacter sp.]
MTLIQILSFVLTLFVIGFTIFFVVTVCRLINAAFRHFARAERYFEMAERYFARAEGKNDKTIDKS